MGDETNRRMINPTIEQRAGQRCHIVGCKRYRSAECTNDAKTCRMLERMRNDGAARPATRGRYL